MSQMWLLGILAGTVTITFGIVCWRVMLPLLRAALTIERTLPELVGLAYKLQDGADRVAEDLAQAHRNADAVAHTEPPGTAADAASRQTAAEQGRP
jgi:type II secretory pathway component PulM